MNKAIGRPQSQRITEALRRVANGETAYRVARDMNIRESQLYSAVRRERARERSAMPDNAEPAEARPDLSP